jgi:hypothetical protein
MFQLRQIIDSLNDMHKSFVGDLAAWKIQSLDDLSCRRFLYTIHQFHYSLIPQNVFAQI